jgi:hypothetical protein
MVPEILAGNAAAKRGAFLLRLLEPAMKGLRWFHANGCALDEGPAAIEAGARTYWNTLHKQEMLKQLGELH